VKMKAFYDVIPSVSNHMYVCSVSPHVLVYFDKLYKIWYRWFALNVADFNFGWNQSGIWETTAHPERICTQKLVVCTI
jgi:hypothetical protein